ncbi:uncharacterized protein LOC133193605 [Saccostrea echinata]|uniref:uncharacterized protein LOC133193605 n=1 Tax=Saccostrea echinata TaxID=191078 RepID=UPI002A823189|nr:uncharacterized protein LOC133193605 [Saccostrea echinata]
MSRGQSDKTGYKFLGGRRPRSICCSCWTRKPWYLKLAMGISGVLVLAVVGVVIGLAVSGPLHASCKIDWTFGISCNDVKTKIKGQISQWTTADNCANGGEKCLYKFVSESGNTLKAKHETPVKHYVDDLTFTFLPSSSTAKCNVQGFSTSETWYALLDYGTNYCNLHNLITGSGLDKVSGYSEKTSDSVCTQYSSANCTVY